MDYSFGYRVYCFTRHISEPLLDKVFVYEQDEKENPIILHETMNSLGKAERLMGDQTLSQVFHPLIDGYKQDNGISSTDLTIERFMVITGNPAVTISFSNGVQEEKGETIQANWKVYAYYHPDTKLDYGLSLAEYQEKLNDHTYALRIGKEVPEGDVNLAYIHTPRLQVEENVALIDRTAHYDNLIPHDQMESLVIPDTTGKLSYASLVSESEPIVPRPPYDVFPIRDIQLTREFKKNEHRTDTALYYKFDLRYHYDSKAGVPGKIVRYTGQQIQITDESGNPLDEDLYKYNIYVQAMPDNPQIYWVRLYFHINTDEEQTFKVLYNHVEDVFSNEDLQSVRKTIELYANQKNLHYVEGGKLRVINGASAYDEAKTKEEVWGADREEEIYCVEEQVSQEGYHIYVPQKSEMDPRTATLFHYRIVATYTNEQGKEQKVTVGYIADTVMDPKALLEHEQIEYTMEWKNIGLATAGGKLFSKEMIEMALPMGTPSIPADAIYSIEDAQGQLLYTTTQASNFLDVDTRITEDGKIPEAKANQTTIEWENAKQRNVRVKNNPIPHRCTIIPEHQKTEWFFTWRADGEGKITEQLSLQAQWKVCAQVTAERAITVYPSQVGEAEIVSLSDFQPMMTSTECTERHATYRGVSELVIYNANGGSKFGPNGDTSGMSWKVIHLEYPWSNCKYIKTVLVEDHACPGGEDESKSPANYGYRVVGTITAPSATSAPKNYYTTEGSFSASNVTPGATLYPWTLFVNSTGDKIWYPGAAINADFVVEEEAQEPQPDPTPQTYMDTLSETICSGWQDVLLTKQGDVVVQEQVEEFMKSYLDNTRARWEVLEGYKSETFTYTLVAEARAGGGEPITARIESGRVIVNSTSNFAGGTRDIPWYTFDAANSLSQVGTGKVVFHADGHHEVLFDPPTLPIENIPDQVKEFAWYSPIEITSNEIEGTVIGKVDTNQSTLIGESDYIPPITCIGKRITLPDDQIFKHEHIKPLNDLKDLYPLLEIPSDIPLDEVLLRIERGEVTEVNENREAIAWGKQPEHRVNYRFRHRAGNLIRMPVDQFQDQLGVNRLRLKTILKEK